MLNKNYFGKKEPNSSLGNSEICFVNFNSNEFPYDPYVVGQPHDRVADQLPGSVEGDLAAAVDVDDRHRLPPSSTGRSCGSVRLPAVKTGGCSSSSTVSGSTRDDVGVHLALQLPRRDVLHGVELPKPTVRKDRSLTAPSVAACGQRPPRCVDLGEAGAMTRSRTVGLLLALLGLVALAVDRPRRAPTSPGRHVRRRRSDRPEASALRVLHAVGRGGGPRRTRRDGRRLRGLYVVGSRRSERPMPGCWSAYRRRGLAGHGPADAGARPRRAAPAAATCSGCG